jgi:hypothetical protein
MGSALFPDTASLIETRNIIQVCDFCSTRRCRGVTTMNSRPVVAFGRNRLHRNGYDQAIHELNDYRLFITQEVLP